MGLHQDKDESPESLTRGLPVVSVSLGDTARFLFGGLRRRDPVETMLLESGDVFVFGGPAKASVSRRHACAAWHRPRWSAVQRQVESDVQEVLVIRRGARPGVGTAAARDGAPNL